MRLSLSVAQPDGAVQDVVVDAEDDTPVGALGRALAGAVGGSCDGVHLDGQRLADDAPVGATRVVDGSVVALSAAAAQATARTVPPAVGWQLHCVSGPDSGLVAPLPLGDHELGRSGAFGFSDRAMSRRHAVLRVTEQGATLADLGSANGTVLEGAPVPVDGAEPPVPVEPGQVLQLGDTALAIVPARGSDAAVEQTAPGVLQFVRAPRMLPSDRDARVVLPAAPPKREPRRFPLIMVLAPLAFGLVLAGVLRQPMYLIFALMSPVMLISNTVSDRRQTSRDQKAAQAEYELALAEAHRRIEDGLQAETVRRRAAVPDAAAAVLTAVLPTKRLWERRRTDPDALLLRVGTADLPAELTVVAPRSADGDETEGRTVRTVPATVSLGAAGVLGVAGPAEPLAGLLRWLVLQLAVQHPPRDLALTVLAPPDRRDWSWVRWLPHARPGDPEAAVAFVGNDVETVGARVAELLALVKARREAAAGVGRVEAAAFPAHVLVVDGVRELRTTPGLAQVLQDGPAVGVYALCADEQERFLPESCTATAVFSAEDDAALDLRRSGAEPVLGVLAERVAVERAEAVARALAPLKDVSADSTEAALPDSVRLLDVLGLEPPTVDAVRARWQLDGRSTRVVLGAGLDGPSTLDLRTDGPHGLIAGTTGAGKSELLQTMIASLAVANRPDALNLVLVDYKGGSAFKDCVALPHTVGMVTDLDAHLVERALTSLSAELKLREHWLADAGVKDLDDYVELTVREPHRPPLPRLLLVIDEFASMARELPDFVTGLVNIAQRGRSLGIHLLLATQRPSGVVSPEIRANTNLRISLRVTDSADSTDVLDAPDAARIAKTTPGRGYARLGAGALVPFQAGRIGGRRPGVRPAVAPVPHVAPLSWHQLGYAAPAASVPAQRSTGTAEVTDLSVLVEAVRQAAEAEGLAAQRSPWLEALGGEVLLDALGPAEVVEGVVPPLPYGLQDLPASQAQRVAAFDPARDGHLLVVGSARSGRSQLLRTLAASVGERTSTADVHLLGLDCGNGALLPLQDLPHCGAVVTRSQTERAVRLLGRLAVEMERRQALLSEGGFADVTEQRRASRPEDRLPHLLLLLDRWEGFTGSLGEVDGGRLLDVVLTVMREGASVGVSAVITGDRSLATSRLASLTDNKLVLRLADRADYSLVGLSPRALPEQVPPGRAFTADGAVETQVALLAADGSATAQAAVIAEVAKAAHVRDALVPRSGRPFRVDVLPSRVGFEQAWEMRAPGGGARFALVGVGGDELTGLGPDLAAASGPAFVVGGPARAGKSTLLAVMAESLLRSGTRIAVCAPKPSPLRALAGRTGVLAVVEEAGAPAELWRTLLAEAGDDPLVLLLDDADVLRDVPAAEVFRDVVKGMAGPGRHLVLAGNAESICTGLSGWQVEAKRSRQGALLSPQGSSDGELVGLRLPRSAVGQAITPGRALLHLGDGALTTVTVPSGPDAP